MGLAAKKDEMLFCFMPLPADWGVVLPMFAGPAAADQLGCWLGALSTLLCLWISIECSMTEGVRVRQHPHAEKSCANEQIFEHNLKMQCRQGRKRRYYVFCWLVSFCTSFLH